jgi:hypothetical protein
MTHQLLGDMAAQLMKKEEKIERLRFFQATRRPRANRDAKTSRNRRWEDPGRVPRIRCSPIGSHAVAFPPAARSSLARAAAFSRRPARSSLARRRAPRFPIACRPFFHRPAGTARSPFFHRPAGTAPRPIFHRPVGTARRHLLRTSLLLWALAAGHQIPSKSL